MTVGVALIACNEAHRIDRCLESVRWADEIVVIVDDRTTDDTAARAHARGAQVVQRAFTDFSEQRNCAQDRLGTVWSMWMDCDEQAPPALAAEVRAAVADTRHAAFRAPRLNCMFGRWIRHGGWYPQHHIRLWRRDRARWAGRVHERPRVEGSIGTLRTPMLHYSHATVADWVEKMARYTSVEADEQFEAGRRIGLVRGLLEAPAYAAYKYVWQQGWRDGGHGVALASLLGCYRLLRNLKWWDLQQRAGVTREPECPPTPRS